MDGDHRIKASPGNSYCLEDEGLSMPPSTYDMLTGRNFRCNFGAILVCNASDYHWDGRSVKRPPKLLYDRLFRLTGAAFEDFR